MWVYCFFKHYVCWRPFWIQWKQYYPGTLRFEVVCPYDDSMKSLECDHGDALFSVGPIKMRGKKPEKLLPKLNYHSCGRGLEFYMQREESSKMRRSQGIFFRWGGGGGVGGFQKIFIYFLPERLRKFVFPRACIGGSISFCTSKSLPCLTICVC